jgi:hypothetical protein
LPCLFSIGLFVLNAPRGCSSSAFFLTGQVTIREHMNVRDVSVSVYS